MGEETPGDLAGLTADAVAAVFESTEPFTVGLEEEVMLLDPGSLDLRPCATEVLERLGDDRRFKGELPASQVEILTEPTTSVVEAIAALARARADLAAACEGLALPAVAAVHPFAAAEGELRDAPRYEATRSEYGSVARRQLVASLQVHVAVGGAERTLWVYNQLRDRLPEIAALAANGAIYGGRDTGLASVRPKIAETLPRQGLPPAIASWEGFARELRWGAAAGVLNEPGLWWWELRPHIGFGTLEVRVPDAQTTIGDAGAIAALVQAMVAWLAERDSVAASGDPVPDWRIEENRWSAARHGVEGRMADLESGESEPTRERLHRLLDRLGPIGERLGTSAQFDQASRLVERNGAIRQRELFEREGAERVASELAERFCDLGRR